MRRASPGRSGSALPAGYATSSATCRAFLEQHAPRKPAGDRDAAHSAHDSRPATGFVGRSQSAREEATSPHRRDAHRQEGAAAQEGTKEQARQAAGRRIACPSLGRAPTATTPLRHSLWQQGCRPEAWCPLQRRRLVRASRRRSRSLQGQGLAVTGGKRLREIRRDQCRRLATSA